MDVTPLATVDEIRAWIQVGPRALKQAEDLAAPAFDLRQHLRGIYTSVPVSVWWNQEQQKAASYRPEGATDQDLALVTAAVKRAAEVRPVTLGVEELQGPDGSWVKLAYSPAFRHAGEAMNLVSGNYPGGIPNFPGPVSSMLTSGLLGAGLGYGGGYLAEKLLPDRWEKGRLSKTMAILGGAAGMTPGLVYGLINKHNGLPFNDNSATAGPPVNTTPARFEQERQDIWKNVHAVDLGGRYKAACAVYAREAGEQLRARLKAAWDGPDEAMAPNRAVPQPERGPMDINVNALGQTLWQSGASPQTAGMTMGAMAAAAQMPGGTGDPGWVTPWQVAELGAHMGAGYVSGAIVGHALGLLTGMPEETQNTLKRVGMYAALAQALIPKLFGA